jgi:hypothetical protein
MYIDNISAVSKNISVMCIQLKTEIKLRLAKFFPCFERVHSDELLLKIVIQCQSHR